MTPRRITTRGADSPELWEDVIRSRRDEAARRDEEQLLAARLARIARLAAQADGDQIALMIAKTLGVSPEDLTERKE